MPQANLVNQVVNLVVSASRNTSSNSGNLKDTTGNIPTCEAMAVYLIITVMDIAPQSATSGTNGLSVYLETSVDGGTTWVVAGAFVTISGAVTTTSAQAQIARRMDFHGGVFAGEVALEQSVSYSFTSGALGTQATKGNTPLTRDTRVSWNITGGSATFAVFAICVPYGQRA